MFLWQEFTRYRLYPPSSFDFNDSNAAIFSRSEAEYLRMIQFGKDKDLVRKTDIKT